MALLFPWATKEYLLWEMTIGQMLMYYNKAIDIQNGTEEKETGLNGLSVDELRKLRDDAKEQFAIEDLKRKELEKQYGDIG